MEFLGTSALRCWPVDVEIVGRQHRIPALPAISWILALSSGNWSEVVPGLVEGNDDTLDARISTGDVTYEQMTVSARDAVAVASGLPWWAAGRLVGISISNALVAGALVAQAVDATRVSLGAWCAATYHILTREADAKQMTKVDRELLAVPEGLTAEERYDEQRASDAFEALFAARTRNRG